MNFLNRDKETVSFYKKENKRLRSELTSALNKIKAIEAYKNEYEDLIAQVKRQQKHYEGLNKKYESLIGDCKDQLNEIMEEAKESAK